MRLKKLIDLRYFITKKMERIKKKKKQVSKQTINYVPEEKNYLRDKSTFK